MTIMNSDPLHVGLIVELFFEPSSSDLAAFEDCKWDLHAIIVVEPVGRDSDA